MKAICIALAAMIAAVSAPIASAQSTPAEDAEGLAKVKVSGLQSVHARPDADFSRYSKVMLDPIAVSFSKSWARPSGPRSPTAVEKRAIQEGLERVLREEFARELARGGRYRLVEAAGEDVLRIKAEIRDLYINAPDLQRAGVTRSYTKSAGEMTLVAELRDAASNTLLARVIDRARDPESAWFELTTRVDNIAAARSAAADWARILRAQLDAARGPEK